MKDSILRGKNLQIHHYHQIKKRQKTKMFETRQKRKLKTKRANPKVVLNPKVALQIKVLPLIGHNRKNNSNFKIIK